MEKDPRPWFRWRGGSDSLIQIRNLNLSVSVWRNWQIDPIWWIWHPNSRWKRIRDRDSDEEEDLIDWFRLGIWIRRSLDEWTDLLPRDGWTDTKTLGREGFRPRIRWKGGSDSLIQIRNLNLSVSVWMNWHPASWRWNCHKNLDGERSETLMQMKRRIW